MSLAKPKGVRFSDDELNRLDAAALALGIKTNHLIRLLVDKGLAVLEKESFDLNFSKTEFERKPTLPASQSAPGRPATRAKRSAA